MLVALHIILGVLTPHLGTIFTGVFSLLKAKQDVKLQDLKAKQDIEEKKIEEEEEEDRLAHKYQNWSDKIAPAIKLIVVCSILALFVWAEISGDLWEDDFRRNVLSFVVAHAMSQGVLLENKFKSK